MVAGLEGLMWLGAQFARIARLIVTIEPIGQGDVGQGDSDVPAAVRKRGLLELLFGFEALPLDAPEAQGARPRMHFLKWLLWPEKLELDAPGAPGQAKRGLLNHVFAVESLPLEAPEPAKERPHFLKWLLWPEKLGRDER